MKLRLTTLILAIFCMLLFSALISCNNEGNRMTVTVTFNSNGGSSVEVQEILSGECAEEPPVPTKEGYTFEGWYKGKKKWDFFGAIKSDITLIAKWVPTEYTITYIGGRGELEKFSPYEEYDLNDYESWTSDEGCSVVGWYLDKELTKPITKIEKNTNSNLTLYAKVAPLKFVIINNECTVDSCHIEAVNVTVPDTYNGYKVTNIGPKAFYQCVNLECVTLPSTIKTIGINAFEGCALLESIHLPSSIEKIGSSAFRGCKSLKSIEIPEKITNIHSGAFYGCEGLKSVKLLGNNLIYVSANAFFGCVSLEKIDLSRGVKSVNSYAFGDCVSLKYVLLGLDCRNASSSAFNNCPLVTVYHMASEIPHENWNLGVGDNQTTVIWGYNKENSDISWE